MQFSSDYQPEKRGRKAGSPNKITAASREALATALSGELAQVPELLQTLEPKDRLEALAKLLPFVLPKLREVSTEVESKNFDYKLKEFVVFSSE